MIYSQPGKTPIYPPVQHKDTRIKNKIRVSDKTGLPINEVMSSESALKMLNKLSEDKFDGSEMGYSITSELSQLSIRPKDETPEQKRLRKQLLKDYRRERRLEKKIYRLNFKEDYNNQVKIDLNKAKSIQGNRLLYL